MTILLAYSWWWVQWTLNYPPPEFELSQSRLQESKLEPNNSILPQKVQWAHTWHMWASNMIIKLNNSLPRPGTPANARLPTTHRLMTPKWYRIKIPGWHWKKIHSSFFVQEEESVVNRQMTCYQCALKEFIPHKNTKSKLFKNSFCF